MADEPLQDEAGNSTSPWTRFVLWLLERPLASLVLLFLLVIAGVGVAPFDWGLSNVPRSPIAVDAIPDVGENQQIIFTEWPGHSPRDVEDQITYPLTTSLLGVAGVRTVRSTSAFGFSSIYVIFDDDVDFYWSRSRVLEKLSSLPPETVPAGVRPTLGPDATALGQVFWYTLEGRSPDGRTVDGWDLHELRSIQDWTVRYALQSVPGVAEVASIGGYVREYQVDVDSEALRANGVSLQQVAAAVRDSNLDVGARTLEINRVEYVVRGLGFIKDRSDIEESVVASRDHTPIRVRDVARVSLGPALRRGALDDGGAPAVGGIVVARYRANALDVIDRVKQRVDEISSGLPSRVLPDGTVSRVTVVPYYDRTDLIKETLATLSGTLHQQLLIAILVVVLFLRSLPVSFVVSSMLPLSVLGAFVLMKQFDVEANIMALAGIAIAIGTVVDMAIVIVDNVIQHFDRRRGVELSVRTVAEAVGEVAGAVTTSALTTIISFLPVLALTSAEARLFTPLALAKTFVMTAAIVLSLVVLPVVCWLFIRRNPESTEDARSSAARFHPFDALLCLGGILLLWFHPVLGTVLVILATIRVAARLVSPSFRSGWSILETVLVVAVVIFYLSRAWQPLGQGASVIASVLFVAVLSLVVIALFFLFQRVYPQLLRLCLSNKKTFLTIPTALFVVAMIAWVGFANVFSFLPQAFAQSRPGLRLAEAFPGLGREYMPPFDEGAFLYMPVTMPHASIGEVSEMLQDLDMAIAGVPEVDRVVGKLGRAETALDPAPVSMIEAVVAYKPEYIEGENGRPIRQWRDHIKTSDDIWEEIAKAADRPGLTSAPLLMPIAARNVMLQSGMRSPMGIKVSGRDLHSIEAFGLALESIVRAVPGVRPDTVFAERVIGKPYIEIDIDREAIARYGLSVVQVQNVLQVALGGAALTHTVEGRERYAVRVRYAREERDSLPALERIFVPTSEGEQVPLSHIASIQYVKGPQVIRSEDTFLTSYVLFDKEAELAEVDLVGRVAWEVEARIDRGELIVPPGVSYRFAGTYENQLRTEQRLLVLIPIALLLIVLLLYLQFRRLWIAAIVFAGVLVACSGGFLLLWLYSAPWFLNFDLLGVSLRELFRVGPINVSIAVGVGFIALFGIATDDGVVMATYLDQRFRRKKPTSVEEIRGAVVTAGRRRIRPCLMTTATTLLALLPVVSAVGKGSDVMMPMALPIVGGMTIELLTLFVVPVLYCARQERALRSTGI